jgi:hypothetical protein
MRAVIDDIVSIFRSDPWIEARREIASANNWRFSQRKAFAGEVPEILGFRLFKGKGARRMTAVLEASTSKGGHFRFYDYLRYNDLKKKKEITVFEFVHPALNFPAFRIQPRRSLSRIRDMFVTSDLMMPTTPDFNARYAVDTADPGTFKDNVNIEFLDMVGDEPGWKYEGKGRALIAYWPGSSLPPDVFRDQVKRFVEMCRTLSVSTS